jgi:threonine synthase
MPARGTNVEPRDAANMPRRAITFSGGSTTTCDSADGWSNYVNGLSRRASVVCLLCGRVAAGDDLFWGCGACGVHAPLALTYPPSPHTGLTLTAAVGEARQRYAVFGTEADAFPTRAPTPLDLAPRFGRAVYLKNETFSLTGSHKDRFTAVVATMARLRGSPGMLASSTGNHGVSVAAHAAVVGLPSVIFCHPEAPAGLLRAIGAFGGIAAQLEPDAQRATLVELVKDGWFPATSMDPALSGAANPFGAEGYKAVAYEIVEQLGALPDAVIVPTAGGDTYYGIAKGFAEIAEIADSRAPILFAIQPEGANALSRSLARGRQVTIEQPRSIALSLSDPQTGRQAMVAIERWSGHALDVAETAIRTAVADLAGMGIYADPASAAALAGYRHAIELGAIASNARTVLLLTSSGFKWPDAMVEVFPADAVRSDEELRRRLAAMSGTRERVSSPEIARQPLAPTDREATRGAQGRH